MKKISLLFAMLTMVVSGAWADDVTIMDGGQYTIQPYNYNNYLSTTMVADGTNTTQSVQSTSTTFEITGSAANGWKLKNISDNNYIGMGSNDWDAANNSNSTWDIAAVSGLTNTFTIYRHDGTKGLGVDEPSTSGAGIFTDKNATASTDHPNKEYRWTFTLVKAPDVHYNVTYNYVDASGNAISGLSAQTVSLAEGAKVKANCPNLDTYTWSSNSATTGYKYVSVAMKNGSTTGDVIDENTTVGTSDMTVYVTTVKVTQSTNYSTYSTYYFKQAFDGDKTNKYWTADNQHSGQYFQTEFSEYVNLSQYKVYYPASTTDYMHDCFELQTSEDGTTWTKVGTFSKPTSVDTKNDATTFDLTDANGIKFVRAIVSEGATTVSNWIQISELTENWEIAPAAVYYDVTFNYTYNDVNAGTVVKNYKEGTEVTEAPACPTEFYTAGAIEKFTVTDAMTVEVTAVPSFPFTANKYYWLNNVGNKGVNAARYVTYDGSKINTIQTTKDNILNNGWMFIPVENTLNQFYIKNGSGKYLNSNVDPASTTTTKCSLTDTKEAFTVVKSGATGNNTDDYVGFSIQATTTDGNGAFIGAHVGTGSTSQTIGNITGWFDNQLGCWHNSNSSKSGNGNLFFVEAADDVIVTANMRITSAEWGTFCAPFDVEIPDENIKVYTGEAQTSNWIKLNEIETTTIPANTAVVVYWKGLTDTKSYDFTALAVTTAGQTSCFTGNTGAVKYVDANDYVLQKNYDLVGWYKVEAANSIKIGKNRCYLKATDVKNSARASYLMSFDGEATGINNIAVEAATKADGKYLVNGKMVVVKAGKAYNMNGQVVK